jgi:hypothetical protein
VTIAVPTSGGWTLAATLEEDEFGMLWLVDGRLGTGKPRVWLLLSAALKNGCKIVSATRAERALLEAHGFGSGPGSVMACSKEGSQYGDYRVDEHNSSTVEGAAGDGTPPCARRHERQLVDRNVGVSEQCGLECGHLLWKWEALVGHVWRSGGARA